MTEPLENPWRKQADALREEIDHHERALIQLNEQLADAERRAAAYEQPALFGDVLNLTEWRDNNSDEPEPTRDI